MNLEIIKELNVDFYNTKYIQVNAKQDDKSSRFILVTCYNQGTLFPIDNIYNYAFIRYRKSDDLNVFNTCNITEDGKILIELTEQMLAFDSKCYADLVIVHNEPISVDSIKINNGELLTNENTSILSTMLFCINVIETALDSSNIESSDEYNALNDLLIKATTEYDYVMKACKISEDNSKESEINAKESEESSKVSENNSKTSENNAKASENNAAISEENANTSENNAKISEKNALTHANTAIEKAQISVDCTNESLSNALLSQSYAVGGTGTRINENADNSQYYYSQIRAISETLGGVFAAQGTIEFSELQTATKAAGYVYHISDVFVTDDTFKCGAGIPYPEGTNVYCTADGYWDCFATKDLVVTDDDNGNVTIEDSYNSIIISGDEFNALNNTIIELQERIKALEEQTILEVVE